jgi:histidinol phosphatase-like PHP family hydrolase
MIDLHTHTVFSDGELIPSELVRRADALGIKGIAITDHGDFSNMDHIIPRLVKVAGYLNNLPGIRVLPGIEITHVPTPAHIEEAAAFARSLGAKVCNRSRRNSSRACCKRQKPCGNKGWS